MPEMIQARNIIVVGGGPAGATVAILLAQSGRPVMLIERERYAHHKVCGEFISWEAAHYLKRLGIDLPSLGAQAIHSMRLAVGNDVLDSPLPFEAWSLSRHVLDEALLTKAVQVGVDVVRGKAVTGIHKEQAGWLIETPDGILQTDTLFLATGKHDLRGWRRDERQEHRMIGFKMHFRLAPEQQSQLQGYVEIALYEGGYAGLEAIEDGQANLCLVVQKHRYAMCGRSWEGLSDWLKARSPHLAVRLRGAMPLWPRPLAIYGIPYGYVYKSAEYDPDLFRLGDQMAVIPSFAGDGMSIALHSAFLAARCYLREEGTTAYHRQACRAFRHPVGYARMLSAMTLTECGRHAGFLLLKNFPKLISPFIQSVRLARCNVIDL